MYNRRSHTGLESQIFIFWWTVPLTPLALCSICVWRDGLALHRGCLQSVLLLLQQTRSSCGDAHQMQDFTPQTQSSSISTSFFSFLFPPRIKKVSFDSVHKCIYKLSSKLYLASIMLSLKLHYDEQLFFSQESWKVGTVLKRQAEDSRGQSELSHLRLKEGGAGRGGGGTVVEWTDLLWVSQREWQRQREREKAHKELKNAICDGSRETWKKMSGSQVFISRLLVCHA